MFKVEISDAAREYIRGKADAVTVAMITLSC